MVKVSDLKEMSTKQLHDLIAKAETLIKERRADELRKTRVVVAAMAKELGLSIHELIGVKNGTRGPMARGRRKQSIDPKPTLA